MVNRRVHRSRRPVAVGLLCGVLLQACHSAYPAEGPTPEQDLSGVVLHDGRVIDFPGSFTGTLEDSLVVVRRLRDGSLVETWRAAEIDHVLVDRVSAPKTFLLLGGIGAALVLLLNMQTYTFTLSPTM